MIRKHEIQSWTPTQLRKLPAKQRDAILLEAAKLAEGEYRRDRELTDFQAFSEDDLHGQSTAAEAG